MMNHSDLADAVSTKSGVSKKEAGAVLSAFSGIVSETLGKGEDIRIQGLGTFKSAKRPARKGRNPATGAEMDIAASTKATFSPSKTLKDALNG
jgi:DNA-binding protein HU-beta